jgi:excisionase family DNA binding protein
MRSPRLERHWTTKQVADLLTIDEETVRRAARRGDLPSIRIGNDRRYPESGLVAWIESLAERAA